jgi:hypothetical protein
VVESPALAGFQVVEASPDGGIVKSAAQPETPATDLSLSKGDDPKTPRARTAKASKRSRRKG